MRGDRMSCMREPPRSQQGPGGLCHVQEARVSGVGQCAGARSPVGAVCGVASRHCRQCGPGVVRPGALAVPLRACASCLLCRPWLGTRFGGSGFAGFSCWPPFAVCLQADDVKPF